MSTPRETGREWWRDAVFYQVYIRSFADSDGDGLGDLPGITSRLPYLRALGVDAVWITPFYPSPQRDAGYDVADYHDVDPRFGSLGRRRRPAGEGPRPRPEGDRRPGAQPHVVRPRVVPAGPGRAARAARSGRATSSAPARAAAAHSRPTTGCRSSAGRRWTRVRRRRVVPPPVRHLPARPRLAQPRGAGACSRTSCASGSTVASTASGSTSPTASSRSRACATSAARWATTRRRPRRRASRAAWSSDSPATSRCGTSPRCTASTAPGTRCSRRTTATGWPSAEAWTQTPESMARYVRPDELHQAFNFAWLLAPWSAEAFADVIHGTLDAVAPVGADADLGAVQPRRRSVTPRATAAARSGWPAAARRRW